MSDRLSHVQAVAFGKSLLRDGVTIGDMRRLPLLLDAIERAYVLVGERPPETMSDLREFAAGFVEGVEEFERAS